MNLMSGVDDVQLFSSMTACLVLNVLLSAAIGHPGNLSHPGLVSFGQVGVRNTNLTKILNVRVVCKY